MQRARVEARGRNGVRASTATSRGGKPTAGEIRNISVPRWVVLREISSTRKQSKPAPGRQYARRKRNLRAAVGTDHWPIVFPFRGEAEKRRGLARWNFRFNARFDPAPRGRAPVRAGRARSTRASHRSARGRRRGRPRGRSEPVRASRSRQLASSDRLRAYWRESPARTSRTRRERHPTRFVSILRSRTARAFARARLPRLVGASTGRAIGRTSIARDGYRLLSRFPPSFLSARVRARARL